MSCYYVLCAKLATYYLLYVIIYNVIIYYILLLSIICQPVNLLLCFICNYLYCCYLFYPVIMCYMPTWQLVIIFYVLSILLLSIKSCYYLLYASLVTCYYLSYVIYIVIIYYILLLCVICQPGNLFIIYYLYCYHPLYSPAWQLVGISHLNNGFSNY